MFDVNPEGPLMHLKELERQARAAAHRAPGEDQRNVLAMLRRWLTTVTSRPVARSKESKALLS